MEKYRLLIDNYGNSVTLINRDGIILEINQAGAEQLGGKPDDFVGKPLIEFIPNSVHLFFERSQVVLESGKGAYFEDVVELPTGKRWFLSNLQPWKDIHGEIIGIQVISHEITLRKQAEEQIKQSLEEKEVLLKEIHHRVKNNMQVISSILNLQAGYVKDPETQDMFKESIDRIRSMALVHEMLYQSKDLGKIAFGEYIKSLASYLVRSYRKKSSTVQLRMDVDDVIKSINMGIPCGLIINELISNSLKHAFADGKEGEISIEIKSDGDSRINMNVGDNGIGFPEEIDFRKTKSLGLQLVMTLVQQLGGRIELERSAGTAFRISFQEKEYSISKETIT